MSRPKIIIAEPDSFCPSVVSKLRIYADVDLIELPTNKLTWALENYDVFWFRLGFQINRQVLRPDQRCKILATPVTGIDHIDEVYCQEIGLDIICLRGERRFLKEIRATAELTMGLAMAVMRKVVPAAHSVQQGQWVRDWFRGHELYQKTFGIIGFGRLGAIVGTYAKVFGMEVLAVDPRTEVREEVENIEFLEHQNQLAERADVISIHVNYYPETHHLIGSDFFNHCRPSAYLINTARGGIVDEQALLSALKDQKIKGAAIDVLQNESEVSATNPLIQYAKDHENLLIVPHIGGNTTESFTKTEHFIADKVLKSLAQI